MDYVFTTPGEATVVMTNYMKEIMDSFDGDLGKKKKAQTLADKDAFDEDLDSLLLIRKRQGEFSYNSCKSLYACKRARLDIHTAMANLTMRVS